MMMGLSCLLLIIVCLIPHAHAADELCPDMSKGAPQTPGDMAGVQADIERLNLCVERAKLLKQLDDVAIDRQKSLDKLKNPGALPGGMATGFGFGAIPPLPVSSLPPLAPEPMPAKSITKTTGKPLETALIATGGTWQVRKLWGQGAGAGMHAQLSNGSGTLINVVKGDPLPDGTTVEMVSVKGVTLSQNGKITDLSWEQPTLVPTKP